MKLVSCPKGYRNETQRTVPPEETRTRVRAVLRTAGVTRVADITQLDRVGIPVFATVRPAAEEGAVSVYNGKGATPIAAEVSAMMEGLERHAAEPPASPEVFGRYSDLRAEGRPVIDPSTLVLPTGVDPDTPVGWTDGYDLVHEEEVLLPAHAVYHPLDAAWGRLFRTNTNGIASGNTREEAVFHALMEVIERDAWSLAEAARDMGPVVTGIDGGMAGDLLARFRAAKVEVTVRDLTSDIGVPTIAAVSDDTVLMDPALITLGMGSHTNASIALLRALTETAQSRLTQIHGAREDTDAGDIRRKVGYERMKRLNRPWFEAHEECDLASIPCLDTDDFYTDISTTVAALRRAGLDRVIVSDLTREEIGVPVVRVVVPGLEVFAMDRERAGRRCHAARHHRLSRSQS